MLRADGTLDRYKAHWVLRGFTLTDSILATGVNTSSKYIPCFWTNPLATS
jgi:hypothetical protein